MNMNSQQVSLKKIALSPTFKDHILRVEYIPGGKAESGPVVLPLSKMSSSEKGSDFNLH